MEERKWDDTAKLTDFDEIMQKMAEAGCETDEAFWEAFNNPENKSVALHKPGSVVTLSDGTQYEVQPNGSWKRITPK